MAGCGEKAGQGGTHIAPSSASAFDASRTAQFPESWNGHLESEEVEGTGRL